MGENTFFRKFSGWIGVLFLIYIVFRILFYHTQLFPVDSLIQFKDLELITILFLTSLALIWVSIMFDRGSINRKALLYIGAGFFLRVCGSIIWIYYERAREGDTFISITDIFHLISYIPIFFGIIYKIRSIGLPPAKSRLLLSFLLILSYLSVSVPIVMPIIVNSGNLYEVILSFIYPVIDIILAIFTFYLVAKYAGGRMEKVWIFISLSFYLEAIANTVLAYEIWEDIYATSSWADDFLIWSYLLVLFFTALLRDTFKQ